MNNPWLQKLVTVAFGVAIIVIASFMSDPAIKNMLLVVGGAVIGLAFPEIGKRDDDSKPTKLPGIGTTMLSALMLLMLVVGCSPAQPQQKPAEFMPSTLPPDDPCQLESIVAFGKSCGDDCERTHTGDEVATKECKTKCKQEIDERCKQ